MEQDSTIQEERFLRPKRKREEKGGERFVVLLKKVIRVSSRLLLLFLLLFTVHRIYLHLLEDSSFRLKEMVLEGNQRISRETLSSLSRIEGAPNLFTVRLGEITKRLESHPWIEEVRARKVFPNKVLIRVEERRPIAILQLDELYYIDQKGVVFAPVGDRDKYDYPFLTGLTRQALDRNPEGAKKLITKALELLALAESEKISPLREISEIHMEKTSGLECTTRAEGVEVRMGWDHFGEKLRRLSLIWSDLQKKGCFAESIDCSDLKRMVVKRISRSGDPVRR